MIKIIKKLLKNGHAYLVREDNAPRPPLNLRGGETPQVAEGVTSGHSVYYDLSTFPNYGKLSGNKVEDLIAGARVEVKEHKRNPYDFALWIYKPEHVLQWNTPWGRGYPGWHLECSAMAMKYLGETIDIHTGGEDNKFPHHECEIAQSEGATGKQFARMWLHAKHLQVEGKKMSKSLGNFYTLNDLLAKGYAPRAIRYVLISTHYRETLNFTLEGLKAADSALTRIDELAEKLGNAPRPPLNLRGGGSARNADGGVIGMVKKSREAFIEAMDDDLNISKALATVFEFVRTTNAALDKAAITGKEQKAALKFLKEIDAVLGTGLGAKKKEEIPQEIINLAEAREEARKAKDWKRADELREEIQQRGYTLEDTSEGARIKQM